MTVLAGALKDGRNILREGHLRRSRRLFRRASWLGAQYRGGAAGDDQHDEPLMSDLTSILCSS